MIDLIIWDIYGTLVPKGAIVSRNGMHRLFSRYRSVRMAAATDLDKGTAEYALTQLGIRERIERVYADRDLILVPYVKEGSLRKDLRRICRELEVPLERAVFISDGDKDRREARRVGMRFVHVPCYVSAEEQFSFDHVRLDALPRYRDLRAAHLEL